jgi:hypothetical protein
MSISSDPILSLVPAYCCLYFVIRSTLSPTGAELWKAAVTRGFIINWRASYGKTSHRENSSH